ncbi:monoheme cytochrome C [Muriicola sp. SD30]|uniref:monoheme cytochrome C n=1 Tax=Muriicola sp. SD30 TaxID=3240936 RepID=UPI00181E8222|nr:monoheme cytochrome C [Muriicola sp.]NNK21687.1 monoheme cytochrome C [Flavobacteriaceae bacterium]NNL39551.1 monoheme cytochrome C [Flavobacteriaceae bacterium]
MEDQDKFKSGIRSIYRLLSTLMVLFVITALGIIYLINDPTLSYFKEVETTEYVQLEAEDDFDKIENGIHVRTGFKDAEGLMTVVNNCTNCHSAQLVIQNRMNEERWIATIRWMQETQNLWDLGKNEEIIVNYLVTNYPPKKKGRREILSNIDWYELKE